ncbi:MAG: hypothetical protein AB8G95_18910 [Anaerolineae bacterium]
MESEICYLLFLPYQSAAAPGTVSEIASPKDAPYFFDLGIEARTSRGEREIQAAATPVRVRLQVLDELVWVIDCRYRLESADGAAAIVKKDEVQRSIQQQLRRELKIDDELMEQFTIVLKDKDESNPDEFVDEHAVELVAFLRSLKREINSQDSADVLTSRVRYSTTELTLVDWSGALIIAENGDYESDIDLLKVGKFQLFRYRLIDRQLQEMLQQIRLEISSRRKRWFRRRASRTVQEIVQKRLELLLNFEEIDQSLLMIGDWYSAQLYTLIFERFSLDEWKEIIEGKLNSLESIHAAVEENLRFSWTRSIDFIVYWGWVVLLVAYFVDLFIAWS